MQLFPKHDQKIAAMLAELRGVEAENLALRNALKQSNTELECCRRTLLETGCALKAQRTLNAELLASSVRAKSKLYLLQESI